MNALEKIKLLEIRLRKMSLKDANNYGAQRKIMREIRNLQKKLETE